MNDRLDLGQQLVEIHITGLRNILEIHLPVDTLDNEDLVHALVDHALDHHILRPDDIFLLNVFFDQFDEGFPEFTGLTGSHSGYVLHLFERDRILNGHILKRRILKDHERWQLHLTGHFLS